MNKKIFLYSLASVSILASCSDEIELQNEMASQPLQKGMVKAGLLSVGTSSEDGTRAFSPEGNFVWMPETVDPTSGALLNPRTNQQIGLCWTGVNTATPELGSQSAATKNVFTNYMYEHIGWLDWGQTYADVDECTGDLLNGAYIVKEGKPEAAFAGTYDPTLVLANAQSGNSTRVNKYYYAKNKGKNSSNGNDLNLGSGVFKTENSSVFEGQYIIYFPYTDQFTKGPIVANEPDAFTVDVKDDVYATASKYGFQLGYVNHYDGGHRSANFQTKNYAAFADVQIKLANGAVGDQKIKNVVLYSESEGIIYQTGVSAESVIKAREGNNMNLVEQIASDNDAETNAVFATLKEGTTEYATVTTTYNVDKPMRVVLPVLPQTVSDLKVILINTEDKTAYYTPSNNEFKAGAQTILDIVIKSGDFGTNYIAVDEPTLVSCFKSMYATGGTVKMLRSIDLVKANDNLYKDIYSTNTAGTFAWKKATTITADPSCTSAKLTLKATKVGTAWTPVQRFTEAQDAAAKLTVDVPVVVEGPGCCATDACELYLGGQQATDDNIEITKTLTNYGKTMVRTFNSHTNVKLADVLNYYDDIKHDGEAQSYVAEGGYRKGTWMRAMSKPYFEVTNGASTDIQKTYIANLVNEGDVQFSQAAAATAADVLGNRANEIFVSGNIINNGLRIYDASTQKEKLQAANAADVAGGQINVTEYTAVIVNGYVENNKNVATIDVAGVGHSDDTDGRIDIKKAGLSKNTGTYDNAGVTNLTGGNLDNSKGLFIDRQTAQVGGNPINNGSKWTAAKELADYNKLYENGYELDESKAYITDLKSGIYVAQAETESRLAFIVNDPVISKSADVIEITAALGVDFSKADFKGKDFAGYDVRVNEDVTFRNMSVDGTGLYNGVSALGHCVDVMQNSKTASVNTFKTAAIENNLIVRNGAKAQTSSYEAELTIGNNIFVEDLSTVTIAAFTHAADFVADANAEVKVGNDIRVDGVAAAATIELNKKYTVENDVKVDAKGAFDSNSDANTVKNNFELKGDAKFASYTSTTIENTFNSYAESMFTREKIGGPESRATVNCKVLGKTEGNTITGWPTEMIAE